MIPLPANPRLAGDETPAERMLQTVPFFLASYEDRAKVNAAVDSDGDEESAHDKAALRECREIKRFTELASAVEWARQAVSEEKTFYGQAEVQECLVLPKSQLCKFCVCAGVKPTKYHIVDETGVAETHDNDDLCFNGDEV